MRFLLRKKSDSFLELRVKPELQILRVSGRWESDPLPSPWQGDVLPVNYARMRRTNYILCMPLDALPFKPLMDWFQGLMRLYQKREHIS